MILKNAVKITIALSFFSYYQTCLATASHALALEQTCSVGSKQQIARSQELQDIMNADQKDRQNARNISVNEIKNIIKRDLARRKRVGEIFGEGCFHDAKDYMAAALVYQHGDTPDHYYQAFIWGSKSEELDAHMGHNFSPLAIDRYLISIGKKQLFGTQFHAKSIDTRCICMQPVEQSFPDDVRKKFSGRSLEDNYKNMEAFNKGNCPRLDCDTELKPTPKGSIIGFW